MVGQLLQVAVATRPKRYNISAHFAAVGADTPYAREELRSYDPLTFPTITALALFYDAKEEATGRFVFDHRV